MSDAARGEMEEEVGAGTASKDRIRQMVEVVDNDIRVKLPNGLYSEWEDMNQESLNYVAMTGMNYMNYGLRIFQELKERCNIPDVYACLSVQFKMPGQAKWYSEFQATHPDTLCRVDTFCTQMRLALDGLSGESVQPTASPPPQKGQPQAKRQKGTGLSGESVQPTASPPPQEGQPQAKRQKGTDVPALRALQKKIADAVHLLIDTKMSYSAMFNSSRDMHQLEEVVTNLTGLTWPSAHRVPKAEDWPCGLSTNTEAFLVQILEVLSLMLQEMDANARGSSEGDLSDEGDDMKEDEGVEAWKGGLRMRPLTPEEEVVVHDALNQGVGQSTEVLVTHDSANIDVTRKDFRTLKPGGWLIDEVINVYLRLIKDRQISDAARDDGALLPRVHLFSTNFYAQLVYNTKYNYQNVKAWTNRRSLAWEGLPVDCVLRNDLIIVPLHQESVHWTLAAIDMRAKRITFYDAMHHDDILHALTHLQTWLQDESQDKLKTDFDFDGWEFIERPQDKGENVPWQTNCVDCGVFMCMFANYLAREEKFDFEQSHMSYFRHHMVADIIRGRVD